MTDGDIHREGICETGQDALGHLAVSDLRLRRQDPRPDPDQTLTKASLPQSQLSASVTFLWGRGKLADEFQIQRVECKECAGPLLSLVPKKPEPRFQEIRLEIDPKTAQVMRSVVVDPDGSENAIRYTNLKTQVRLSKETFQLTPPPGTQILDTTAPKAP